ncbi:hypothetical protein EN943_35365 [Mesorhizobium sp. M7A.F.Ca.US.006.01.1.1]|uniref:hypothetical protein n=1 Tax=Mesorhizobium sp. M7A.F.Ca.US.006.01.1.1 TaxID=2496707 RepID=UPI000FCC7BA2|nr:hypothetical protein [Mesorhizobium sp. M7A.F.Ca.US.006.01.1.1]RUZ70889.1 hypothetical protein EN943_35365 [Mesorhizobium sp. M7A.F.Ca.US.006.01.1.1]
MTLVQRSNESGNANQPRNGNDDHAPGFVAAVALPDNENTADLVRRTERMAILVVLGLSGWLMLVPAIYLVLTHGI